MLLFSAQNLLGNSYPGSQTGLSNLIPTQEQLARGCGCSIMSLKIPSASFLPNGEPMHTGPAFCLLILSLLP